MSETRPHTVPTAERMPPGAVLGSYRLLGELSSGNMGTVFRAEHVLLRRPAAVKLLRRDLTTDAELVQRFVNEARAVTACKHPGIVEVYDFGYTPDGHAFIVMELLEGEPLGRRLARLRMSEREALAIAHGIAGALRAAHKVGVIHRDLKPDNVFLVADPDGGSERTKVLDFGIAKLADPSATGHTETGALIGTPLYMAPEQARAAGTIDQRADLYSLGCMLYHMLVGRPPFVAEGGGEIIALQMFGQVEPPSRLAAIAPGTERLVLRLLEKDPAARHGSAAEVMAALADLGVAPGLAGDPRSGAVRSIASSALPAPERGHARRSAIPRVAAIVGVLAIAGTGIAYTALQGGSSAALRGDSAPATVRPSASAAPASSPAVAPASPQAVAPASPQVVAPASPPAAAPASPPAVAPASPQAVAPPRPPDVKPAATRPAPIKHPRGASPAPLARPGAPALPDRAIEVIRDIRQADAPAAGPHTPDGSPMETDMELRKKPTHKDASAP